MPSAEDTEPIWLEQCAAAAHIRQRFGLDNALQYVVGEKFVEFLSLAGRSPEYAPEVRRFAAEIRKIVTSSELYDYLKQAKRKPGSNRRRNLLDEALVHLVSFRFLPKRK